MDSCHNSVSIFGFAIVVLKDILHGTYKPLLLIFIVLRIYRYHTTVWKSWQRSNQQVRVILTNDESYQPLPESPPLATISTPRLDNNVDLANNHFTTNNNYLFINEAILIP
jgi:hypothetical protein